MEKVNLVMPQKYALWYRCKLSLFHSTIAAMHIRIREVDTGLESSKAFTIFRGGDVLNWYTMVLVLVAFYYEIVATEKRNVSSSISCRYLLLVVKS